MTFLSRKPKKFAEISADRAFPYQMGRLVGAAEMAGALLVNQENPDVKHIGQNLISVVSYFFEPTTSTRRVIDAGRPEVRA